MLLSRQQAKKSFFPLFSNQLTIFLGFGRGSGNVTTTLGVDVIKVAFYNIDHIDKIEFCV